MQKLDINPAERADIAATNQSKTGETVFLVGGSLLTFTLFRKPLISKLLQLKDTTVYCIYWGNCENEKHPLEHPNLHWVNLKGNHLDSNLISDLKPVTALIKLIRKTKPTKILSFNAKPILYTSFLCKLFSSKCKTIALMEGLGKGFTFLGEIEKKSVKKLIFRWATHCVDRWIVLNRRDKNIIRSIHMHNHAQTKLNGIGIDLSTYTPQSPEALFNNHKVIFVGRLIPEKGIREFVDIARRVREHDMRWTFEIAGLQVDESGITQKEIDAWAKARLIKRCERIDNIEDFYKSGSILLLPSYFDEGLPATIMEAQACGLPCLVNNTACLRGAIKEGETGYFIPHTNIEMWVDKIKELSDFENYKSFSQASAERATKKFDQNKINKKILRMMFNSDIAVQKLKNK